MAGIYIHVPWCIKVCVYCDFHFSVSIRNKKELLECMIREIDLQKEYLEGESISSIYFGGGTPSVLSSIEIRSILNKIHTCFNINSDTEITLEANPEDLSGAYLKDLFNAGINRLSIGIQSFFDDDLLWMNRRHNSEQSEICIAESRSAGFTNISIDLIYGIPGMDNNKWIRNLEIALKTGIKHLSAYHLTLEEKTVYFHKISKGLMEEPDELTGMEQFETLIEIAENSGYIHYEISNFGLPGYFSKHNTSYWQQKPYLGIGPSANSFNGRSRQWNVRNNSLYIKQLTHGIIPFEREDLDCETSYNEYILTSLRTCWGVDLKVVEERFGPVYKEYFLKEANNLFNEGKLVRTGNLITLGKSGKFFADGIISLLFITA